MKKLCLLLAAALTCAQALALNAEQIYRQASPAVMTILVYGPKGEALGNGTGFLVDADGTALTAYHVIRDAAKATARFSDGATCKILGVVAFDESRDIAVVRVEETKRPFLTVAKQVPAIGSESFVIGAPKGLEFSITEGIVNQVRDDGGTQSIQFSAPVSPGNSGSPLIDSEGRAVGVVSYQRTDGQNLNFAVPTSYVSDMNLAAQAKPLPIRDVALKAAANAGSWAAVQFASTGLWLKLPQAPGVIETGMDKEMQEIARDFRSSRMNADSVAVAITYVEFRKGQCPSTREVADEILRQSTTNTMTVGETRPIKPAITEFSPAGCEEGNAVVVTTAEGSRTKVDCTAAIRKGTKMWIVILEYEASSRSATEQAKAILDSMRID